MSSQSDWVSRKRKIPVVPYTAYSDISNVRLRSPASPSSNNTTSSTNLPSSLLPHLAWTKLSACRVKKPKTRRLRSSSFDNCSEEYRQVVGRAIFFFHDPNSDLVQEDNTDGKNNDNMWFQGRFFPLSSGPSIPFRISSDSRVENSWGLLGVQKAVIDECLRCSEGGYRELDLTVIRHVTSALTGKKNPVRWVVKDLTWTGGDMMRLSTSPYASSFDETEAGAKFEPSILAEGKKALDIAVKCFPGLVERLEDSSADLSRVIVVNGMMDLVVPMNFLT